MVQDQRNSEPVDDDVEGHRSYYSDRTVKDDVQPVDWDEQAPAEDVEGHRAYHSDRTVKDDVQPVAWDDDDSTAKE